MKDTLFSAPDEYKELQCHPPFFYSQIFMCILLGIYMWVCRMMMKSRNWLVGRKTLRVYVSVLSTDMQQGEESQRGWGRWKRKCEAGVAEDDGGIRLKQLASLQVRLTGIPGLQTTLFCQRGGQNIKPVSSTRKAVCQDIQLRAIRAQRMWSEKWVINIDISRRV